MFLGFMACGFGAGTCAGATALLLGHSLWLALLGYAGAGTAGCLVVLVAAALTCPGARVRGAPPMPVAG